MIEVWKSSSWLGRLAAVSMTLVAVLLCVFFGLGVMTGRITSPPVVNPNAIPANVQHSPLAVEKIEACMNQNVRVSASGGLRVGNQTTPVTAAKTVYPNGLIECLYAAGITLEYNGEPVRREVE